VAVQDDQVGVLARLDAALRFGHSDDPGRVDRYGPKGGVLAHPVPDGESSRFERISARFSLARSGDRIGQVSFSTGEGRERKEHKISLTDPQGLFLYHLPFPNAEPLAISDILRKAGVEAKLSPEILDIVDVLIRHGAIEVVNKSDASLEVAG